VSNGDSVTIEVKFRDPEAEFATVFMLRNASVTHAFDSNQRFIEPFVTSVVGVPGTTDKFAVDFQIPTDPFVAVPGWYMVTAVDDSHRPSEAVWILVD
jgi:hypothetical protein